MKKTGRAAAVIFACVLTVLAAVIGVDLFKNKSSFQKSAVMMNTAVSVNAQGKDAETAGESVLSAIVELENKLLSRTVSASAVSAVNARAGEWVDAAEAELSDGDCLAKFVERCEQLRTDSAGSFNPLLGRVSDMWGFCSEKAAVPEKEELDRALAAAKGHAEVNGSQIKIPVGSVLDFGAVGKGIACDTAREILDGAKIKRAVVSVGGSILLYGKGQTFNVGVRNPYGGQSDFVGTLKLGEACVSTSGSYERYFEENGVRYHHILSPETGYPAENELVSVTVVTEDGFLSDALSTACFVMGYEKALQLLEKYNAEAMFVFKDKTIKFTGELENSFDLTDNTYTLKNGAN